MLAKTEQEALYLFDVASFYCRVIGPVFDPRTPTSVTISPDDCGDGGVAKCDASLLQATFSMKQTQSKTETVV